MKKTEEFAVTEAELLLLSKACTERESTIERREQISPDVARRLLHDLRVHQSELEAQNGELLRTKSELEAMRSRYFDLYDRAPVGYCTISETEKILSANFTASELLGMPIGGLVGRPIQQFIVPLDQDIYYLHCKKLFETRQPQSCELRLLRPDRSHVVVKFFRTHQ